MEHPYRRVQGMKESGWGGRNIFYKPTRRLKEVVNVE